MYRASSLILFLISESEIQWIFTDSNLECTQTSLRPGVVHILSRNKQLINLQMPIWKTTTLLKEKEKKGFFSTWNYVWNRCINEGWISSQSNLCYINNTGNTFIFELSFDLVNPKTLNRKNIDISIYYHTKKCSPLVSSNTVRENYSWQDVFLCHRKFRHLKNKHVALCRPISLVLHLNKSLVCTKHFLP